MRCIRTIKQAVTEIREADAASPISEHFLRVLIAEGKIPPIRSGRRMFLDMDTLETYLANPVPAPAAIPARQISAETFRR